MRGDTHRLLSRVAHRGLEKLPPVLLRMDLLAHMPADAAHEPVAVAHRIDKGLLDLTLPAWAAPPVPAVAPPTSFQNSYFLPVERRGSPSAAGGAP